MTVQVDQKAHAFRERLELDIQIDDDLILKAHAHSPNAKDQDQCEIHDLEFGLAFPTSPGGGHSPGDPEQFRTIQERKVSPGSLTIRANIVDRKDPRLVPGQFLETYDPYYFDVRRSPPEAQVKEKLYYQPCAVCGRASNAPPCSC